MQSDYISGIRKLIGTEFILLPSVSLIIKDDDDNILMARHHHNNWWVLPGGMIEPDETPQQAAVREAKEETGLTVSLLNIHGVYGGEEFRIQYANGDRLATS
jgi:8-oxo-dGTP pyrophosphatase MutT (NUDIX family)